MGSRNIKEGQSVGQSVNFPYAQGGISALGNVSSILIVDEDRGVLNQISQSLAICARQYNIYTAQNGRDALRVLKTSMVNTLLTALNLSITQGFELVDYAKTYYPDIRLFVMSEEDPSAIKKRLDALSIYGYIRKPFRIEMVYSVLRV